MPKKISVVAFISVIILVIYDIAVIVTSSHDSYPEDFMIKYFVTLPIFMVLIILTIIFKRDEFLGFACLVPLIWRTGIMDWYYSFAIIADIFLLFYICWLLVNLSNRLRTFAIRSNNVNMLFAIIYALLYVGWAGTWWKAMDGNIHEEIDIIIDVLLPIGRSVFFIYLFLRNKFFYSELKHIHAQYKEALISDIEYYNRVKKIVK